MCKKPRPKKITTMKSSECFQNHLKIIKIVIEIIKTKKGKTKQFGDGEKRGIDSIKNVGDSFQQQLKQQLDLQKEKMHSSVQNDRDQALLKKDPS